jgi:NADH-quinone oxidoreductase subunit H
MAQHFSLLKLACVTAVLAAACETQPIHEVLTLTDLSPRQVEVGDRIVVNGSGFPLAADIRRITLKFAGSLARPGMARCERPVSLTLNDPSEGGSIVDPITGVEHEALYAAASMHTLRVEGGNRIEFTVTEAVMRTLTRCPGEGDIEVPHATLSLVGPRAGVTVEVETVQGTTLSSSRPLRGPRLDVLTPWGRTVERERSSRADAERALADMGLRLAAVHPTEGGLQVERVAPGTPAAEAGLVDGDIVERVDGSTLLGISDFRPSPGGAMNVLSIRRGEVVEDRAMSAPELTRRAPTDVIATAILALVALLVAAFGLSPKLGLAGWAATRIGPVPAPKARDRSDFKTRLRTLGSQLEKDGELAVLAFAAVVSTVLIAPFGQAVFAADPDVVQTHIVTVVAALALAVASAWKRGLRWRDGVRSVAAALSYELGALCAVAGVVVIAGDFSTQGVIVAQGALPWQWNLFRNPLLLLLGVVYASSLLPMAAAARGSTSRGLRFATWGVVILRAMLVATLFLGGTRVPGMTLSDQLTSVSFQMAGAFLFMVRAWTLLALSRTLSARWHALHSSMIAALALRHSLPIAVIALTCVLVAEPYVHFIPASAWELTTIVSSLTTFCGCVIWWGSRTVFPSLWERRLVR